MLGLASNEGLGHNVEIVMTNKVMLTLDDLKVLAATAERNGTSRYFPGVALQWAAGALAEIGRLRTNLDSALTVCRCAARVVDSIAYQGVSDDDCDLEVAVRKWRALGPNVRAKLATTAWRAGQQAQNGAKPQRLMVSVTRRWRSA